MGRKLAMSGSWMGTDTGRMQAAVRLVWLFLAIVAFSAVPFLTPGPWVPSALADDDGGGGDDGGGDDDGDDDGGAGIGQTRSERIRGTERARPAIKKKAPVRKAAAARPVLVVLDLPEAAQREARRRGFSILSDTTLEAAGVRVQRMRLPPRMSLRTARRIMTELGAAATDANTLYRPQEEEPEEEPEDCGKDGCPPLTLVGWTSGKVGGCFADPIVGLVETTVDVGNAALAGQSVEVIDLRPEGRRKSGSAHGTAVAAIVAGAEGTPAAGLLPRARIVAAVPYYRSSRGNDVAEAFDVVRAIDALLKRQPHVINLSLAGPENAVLKRVIERAVSRGVPVVAAAGNAGAGAKPLYPAAYDETVAVTAVSQTMRIYRRASRGEYIDFAAPGVELPVAAGKGRVEKRSGTSYAAPYVAAALAVLRQQDPASAVDVIVARLAASARDLGEPGRDKTFGWGLLQASGLCGKQE